MPNAFDPYREALVVEARTVWPGDYDDWSATDRERVEAALHATPQEASDLDYCRVHSGFARVVTVTADDLARLGAG